MTTSEPARGVCPKCGGIGTILGRCKLESGNYGEVEVECSCQIKQPARDGIDVEEAWERIIAETEGPIRWERTTTGYSLLESAVKNELARLRAELYERDAARARAEAKLAEYDTYVNSFGPGIRTAGKITMMPLLTELRSKKVRPRKVRTHTS